MFLLNINIFLNTKIGKSLLQVVSNMTHLKLDFRKNYREKRLSIIERIIDYREKRIRVIQLLSAK